MLTVVLVVFVAFVIVRWCVGFQCRVKTLRSPFSLVFVFMFALGPPRAVMSLSPFCPLLLPRSSVNKTVPHAHRRRPFSETVRALLSLGTETATIRCLSLRAVKRQFGKLYPWAFVVCIYRPSSHNDYSLHRVSLHESCNFGVGANLSVYVRCHSFVRSHDPTTVCL